MATVEASRSESASTPQYLSKDIRDLQVMQDRVLADNPLEDETESPLGDIVPAEWRVVRLEHTEPNGTRHIIERGMPLDEIEGSSNVAITLRRDEPSLGELDQPDTGEFGDVPANRCDTMAGLPTEPLTVGRTILVDLPEHGISADFTVTAILPCPTPNPGDGYLVTTKFIHENAEILDLRIEGSDEAIGTTASHTFCSGAKIARLRD